jgi:ligand-binding sensor domain-containing protein/signal transduction histidine kinase
MRLRGAIVTLRGCVHCLAVACGLAFAAQAIAADNDLRFETHASEKGLSENTVKAIAEDRDGFLWFGTENGLDRFDGLEFTVFRAGGDPARELAEDHVNALLPARDGRLWVGTFGGGASRYDPATGAFANLLHDPRDPRSLASNDVSALHESRSGAIWIGTRGGGLHRVAAGTLHPERIALPANAAGTGQVTALAGDGDEGVWVGTADAGLARLDGAGHASAIALPDDFGAEITALAVDGDGALWVGSRLHGLARRDRDGAWRQFTHDEAEAASLAHATINRLYVDARGQLWIATARGLDRFDPPTGTFAHQRHDPADPATLPYNDVFAVLLDAQGTLWVGTGGGGVARHVPPDPRFTLLEHRADDRAAAGTSAGGVWSVPVEAGGRVWVGTLDGGLQVVDEAGRRYGVFRPRSGAIAPLGSDDVRGLAEGEDDALWVGTRRGLVRLDRGPGATERFLHDPAQPGSLAHDYVRPLVRDARGTLWIGTYGGGLDRLDAGSRTFVHHRNDPADPASLSDDRVYSLLVARDGAVWVGTHGGGLDRLDPATRRFARFRHDPRDPRSLASDRVLALREDPQGRLWIGTGAGLDRFDAASGRFVHVESVRGLVVYGVADDPTGQLWLSTSDGLARVDPRTGQAQRYPMWELWGNSEFNGGAWHRGRSGALYFGGVSGLVRVRPDVPREQAADAAPVLTDFLLFNRPVRPAALDPASPLPRPLARAERITLTHEDDVFGFAFAAPRASHPERRVYAYRLDGFDDRWIETRARRREATYTGVPAGDYVFRVRVSDADGAWLPQEARVALTVRPAPWRSPLAYAAYAAVLLGLLAYWLWLRHRRGLARRRAQEALRVSEQRLSLALWGSGDELLDWDLEAGMMRRMGGADGRAAQGTGGLNDIDSLGVLIHPDDFPAVRDALLAHFRGETEHLEVVYRERTPARDWPWKLVRARVVARHPDGTPKRFAGMQQDITRLKAVESELRELNEALDARVRERTAALEAMVDELRRTQGELVESEKMASLGRLVAGVAHEVNTPLGVGVTAVSYLRAQVAGVAAALRRFVSPEEAERLVAPIDQAAAMTENNLQRAANLVKTFKQVAVDQANPERRTIVLRDYLEATLQSLRPKLKPTGHRVELHCDPAVRMTGRPDALHQVVVNLVMNSVFHGYPDGRAGRLALDVDAVDGQVRVVYRDDGVGMPADVAARIFEPFFTTRRGSGGTGLGLHIVYNLVTQGLGGKIGCATAPGEGVAFTIVFPQGY